MLTDFAALRHVYFFQARSHHQACFFRTPCSTCNEKDDMKENGNTIEHKTGKKKKSRIRVLAWLFTTCQASLWSCVLNPFCVKDTCALSYCSTLLQIMLCLPLQHDWRPGPSLRSFTTGWEIMGHFYALPPGRCPEHSWVSGDYLAIVGGAELPEGHCGEATRWPNKIRQKWVKQTYLGASHRIMSNLCTITAGNNHTFPPVQLQHSAQCAPHSWHLDAVALFSFLFSFPRLPLWQGCAPTGAAAARWNQFAGEKKKK